MHNIITITRSELYDLVWSKPMIKLAKEFNLSDNGLRKICKKYNIPKPPMGHWQKLEHNKKIKVIRLPKAENVSIEFSETAHPSKGNVNLKDKDYIDALKSNQSLILKITDRLSNPDEIIKITQRVIEERLKDEWARGRSTVVVNGDAPRIAISKTLIPRTLRFLDVLVKNLRAVGYKLAVESEGLIVYSESERMEIHIKEKETATDTVNERGWKSRTLSPSGKLSIKFRCHWPVFEFTDDKTRQVEDRMLDILAKIENEFSKRKERERIWAREQEKAEALRKINEEKQKRKDNELQKFVTFYNDAHRWKKYMILKEYYDYLKTSNIKDENELLWIQKKLDWYNPALNMPDELLSEIDKEKLVFKK